MADIERDEIRKPQSDAEAQAFMELACQSLFLPCDDPPALVKREGIANMRVAHRGGRLVGGLSTCRMGQWFGGRSVPIAGLRLVAVAPEHRSAGVALQLTRSTLEELHRDGVPLATLFPSTQPVYRRAGFEQAGVRLTYSVPADRIMTRERALEMRPIEISETNQAGRDRRMIQEAYTERARTTSGNLDRSEWAWRRVLDPPPWWPSVRGYLVECKGRVTGYVVYGARLTDALSRRHELEIADLVALDADTGRRLLTFISDHRSMVAAGTWCGAPADPLHFLLGDHVWTLRRRGYWMVRIVDVRGALEARGYPPGLTGEFHLDVVDDILPHNHRRFVLEVADSVGHVREGGSGDVRLDVRGLAAMYTGHISPPALKAAGLLDGADQAMQAAGAMFAGPAPWMSDMF